MIFAASKHTLDLQQQNKLQKREIDPIPVVGTYVRTYVRYSTVSRQEKREIDCPFFLPSFPYTSTAAVNTKCSCQKIVT